MDIEHDHGIEINDEDLSKDENEKDEMEWTQFIIYLCPHCGCEIDPEDYPFYRKYSKLYKCEMEFIKCPQCYAENVYRM
jgi:hypothetical protein